MGIENKKLTTSEFIKRAKLIHNKYDYSSSNYLGANIKLKIICLLHGEFEQTPYNHVRKKQGCPKCSGNILLTTKIFIERAVLKHNNKYDYSLVNYINGDSKVKIICPSHGIFEQKAYNHLRGDGCLSCTGFKQLTNEDFIQKSIIIHGNKYDYSLVNYINQNTKVKIICPNHGEFLQNPNNHLNNNGCPICKESKGEKIIRNYLIDNNIKYYPQYRFLNCRNILPLPFDFYLPDYNICIEFNGRQHYVPIKMWGGDKELIEIQKRDKIKMEYCQNNNIPLISVKYNEKILNKLQKLIYPKS